MNRDASTVQEKNWGPIRLIPGKKNGRYPYCHSLYIEAGRKTIVDPSSSDARLLELKERPGVDGVILSHYHEDHFKYLYLFSDRDLWMSSPDAAAFRSLDALIHHYGDIPPEQMPFWVDFMENKFNFRPRTPERTIQAEETLDLGGVPVRALSTPGHTPGHMSFWFPEQKVLFLGDYDLTPFGPWYGDRYSDIDQTIASVERLREVPAEVWIAGHEAGLFESDPGALWDEYLGVIDRREAQLWDLLAEPKIKAEIIDAHILYRKAREPREFFDFGEWGHMSKHLERMENRGQIRREGRAWVRI